MRKTILAIAILSITIGCKKEEIANPIAENQKPIEQLISGNQRFINEKSIHPHQDKKTVLKNQNEQHPFAVVLTCSDSRVSPEVLFDQGLGDLFVIRNAGNLISDIDMGSIEYAVEHLDVKLIVVLGHTECGAIKAYIADKDNLYKKHLSHIDDIVETLAQEKEEQEEEKKMPKDQNLLGSINANIAHSTNLITQNPIVKEKHPKIVSMRYDVHTGKIVQL
ncbi:carbonic anhydrase [Flavobacterium caseinilyticum]|uniref:Carbonic anhydrase n=1 Tax=Flavobacterium caseinilyticum TaxID=2541732 RepID=A0A4R5AYN8_9FLAO|nr:carbonic anhydrase [Flavobacterium caseinilyticum]TDD77269.1 carbonic anhydrase [Flavobacterium caseinilyticum]